MRFLFYLTPDMVWLIFGSWLFAIAMFFAWRKLGNPLLLYVHVTFLFLPFFAFALSLPCSMPWSTSLFQFCSIMWTKLFIYIIPVFVILTILFGYVLLPTFYTYRLDAKKYASPQMEKFAKKMGIRKVHLYWFDTMKPVAFSIRNTIFISQGIIELFVGKECEAVLLHELYHVHVHSGWKKFSTMLGRFITPLVAFSKYNPHLAYEEKQADQFACFLQGTNRYILQAKRKLEEYEQEVVHAQVQ